jgi:pyruvate/2-oxoglutarate dehydrogenase complex dihydrolipoamide acyltransferase (E2) component
MKIFNHSLKFNSHLGRKNVMDTDLIGTYTQQPFPATRIVGVDTLRLGKLKNHIPVLAEIDVTLGRERIQKQKEETGKGFSFTGWIIACLARAASEHKPVHAVRRGRNKVVVFDDIDVNIVIQRQLAGREPPEFQPLPYVIRKANEKSVEIISAEIRAAQTKKLSSGEVTIDLAEKMPSARMMQFFARMPFTIRKKLYWNRLLKDPFRLKRTMGTVGVTSVGMFGKVGSGGAWGIPLGFHPLILALGAIARKPAMVGNAVEAREFLCVTILFDHEVIDGAPLAKFLQRLRELIEAGYGLE